MKKLILILLFIPFISYGQIFIFEDNDLEWDIAEMTIAGQISGLEFEGKLIKLSINNEDYYLLENINGTIAIKQNKWMLPTKYDTKTKIDKLIVTTSTQKDFLKAIKKNNYSKITVIYNNGVSVNNKEKYLKKQSEKKELDQKKQIAQKQLDENIKNYGGVYKVKIYSTSGITLRNEYGKLYITEQGFTLKTDVPSIQRVSGSFSIPVSLSPLVKDGEFTGNLSKKNNSYDNFALTINKDITAAGLTLLNSNYSLYSTTTLIIEEKILE